MIKFTKRSLYHIQLCKVRNALSSRSTIKPHIYKPAENLFYCNSTVSLGTGFSPTQAYLDWRIELPFKFKVLLWATGFINSSKRILANKGTRSS